ncbi:MAG: hypothetical protein GY861_14850 [bacterium]|nr:hypothetical protein [bacterium]
MAFELTAESAATSLVVMFIIYGIAFAFQMYMLYLNWKQSKVKDTTTDLVNEVKAIRKLLEKKKGKK